MGLFGSMGLGSFGDSVDGVFNGAADFAKMGLGSMTYLGGKAIDGVSGIGGSLVGTAGNVLNKGLDVVSAPLEILKSPMFMIMIGVVAIFVLPKLLEKL